LEPNSPAAVGASLGLVLALTGAIAAVSQAVTIDYVGIIYLIPVLVAAIRWGVVPAIVAAVAGIAASAFFFYPPIFDLRVHKAEQIIDLALFIIVAVVTGRLATNLRRAKMREQADKLREALIDSVSHELRTPLASIVGSASVLAQSAEVAGNARLAPLVRGMRDEAERLNDRIQNLLDATRISSEGVRPQTEWVDPADIVNTALAHKRRLLADRAVVVSLATDLPLVQADATLVENAFGHMIENAAKYSPPDTPIEISVTHHGGLVRLAVRDHGAGLSADDRRRAWERFYRGAGRRDVPGTGLGLWIARALVEASGGSVAAESAGAGQGATFAIELPVPAKAPPPSAEALDE
jgi:two-component system sensor histidine kinase KdpD